MTEFEPLRSSQTPSTSISFVAAALVLFHAGSALGIGYNPERPTGEPTSGVQFHYAQSESTGSRLQGTEYNATSDEFLLVQMEGLFRRLIESQTAIETEFHSAFYKNRSEMYTLF